MNTRPRRISRLSSFILTGILVWSSASSAQTTEQRIAARAFFDALTTKQTDRLVALQHPTFLEQMKPPRWIEVMDRLEKQIGAFREHRFRSSETHGSYASIVHRAYFAKDSIDFRVVVDSMNLIGGFWLDEIQRYSFQPPPYASSASFRDEKVTFGDSVPLYGQLTIPEGPGPFSAVVLLHGTGPHDRDATFLGNKIFRDIAQGLATRGVVVLRYDKRTRTYAGSIDPTTLTIEQEVMEDAEAAVRFLKARSDVDTGRLSIIGHSLGAMMTPLLAQRNPAVKGIALMASPARHLEEVILEQLKFFSATTDTLTVEQRTMLEMQVQSAKAAMKEELPPKQMILNAPASYYYALHGYDQVETAKHLSIPILLLQGGKDYQIPYEEYEIWKRNLGAFPNVRFHLCEKCYHQFIETEEKPGPKNYSEEGYVALSVIQELAKWAKRKPW